MSQAISLDALRVLDAIERKGSFAAAAEALFKVPSALTYTMQKLETDLDVKLFDRKGQRAVLTEAGKLVLEEGREILNAAERLEGRVKQLESGWEPRLTIAIDTIMPYSPLFNVVREFRELDRQVDIHISEEAVGGGWDALYTQRADLAIGVTGEQPRGLYQQQQIGELEFEFAVAANHPLASHVGPLKEEDLRPYAAVVVGDSSRQLPGRDSGLLANRRMIRVESMQAKIAAQQAGAGVGFIPRHLLVPYQDNGALVVKECEFARPTQPVYLAWPRNRHGKALIWFAAALSQQRWFGELAI